ncbi:MAG: hypothetical protein IPL61_13780 [Myxococcales bacterium]|nr:hypothetical protein [Myxococcales bacterium]
MSCRLALAVVALVGCATVLPRFPDDVQTAVVRDDMRRMETARLVLYYPAPRRAEAERVAARLEQCAGVLDAAAPIANELTRRKLRVVLPEAPFNNAYVFPPAIGIEDVAVIPTGDTLDFVTEFGLPPDPGMTGCHELTHYVHVRQIAGLWRVLDDVFGDVATPQGGFDPWFLEGLATVYEAKLLPGVGRPRWPVFTSMFHAAYAGGAGLTPGSLSEYGRLATPGHHYLVGTIFVGWLAETYGDDALWRLIGEQASSASIVLGLDGRFDEVYGKGVDELFTEFRGWVARRYPRRSRPAAQRIVRALGTDARWAWAADGTTAIVDEDVDRPTRLVVRNPDGRVVDELALTGVLPGRTLAIAGALLTTGLGFTADGQTLYLTALDLGATFQTTRLLRLRVGSGRLEEVARDLGSGGGIAPDGATYYALASDGDRWSLVAYDLATRARRVVWSALPGQYALRVAVSLDGRQLAVSVWDGGQYAIWLLDAASGARLASFTGSAGGPVYDAAFTPDGRVVFLDAIDGRFQVAVASGVGARAIVTDAPYGALEPRVVGDRLRFQARAGWRATLDEVALPPALAPPLAPPSTATPPSAEVAAPPAVTVRSDRAYSRLDGLLVPRLRVPTVFATEASTAWGVALGGGDRLGYLRWGGALYVDGDTHQVSGDVTVLDASLAPWQVLATAARQRYRVQIGEFGDGVPVVQAEAVDAGALTVGRSWRGASWVQAAALAERRRAGPLDRTLRGAQLAAGYGAFEGTLYGGARRGWSVAADATVFAELPGDAVDGPTRPIMIGGRATAVVPVPVSDRLTLHAAVRARRLLGRVGELLVGGTAPGTVLWIDPAQTTVPAEALPGAIAPVERVRGLETIERSEARALIGEVDLRYPLILDRGWAHLAFLPASFLRQLDLELFGAAVSYASGADLTYGAAVTVRVVLFRAPLALRYQLGRLDSDYFGQRTSQVLTLRADL